MRRNFIVLMMILLFAFSGCTSESDEPTSVEQITFMHIEFDPPSYEVFVITPDYMVKHYDFTQYWMDTSFDYFTDPLPPDDQYTVEEWQSTEVQWNSMVDVVLENKFLDLPETIELKDGNDFGFSYIQVVANGVTYKSGGYGAEYVSDKAGKSFKAIMSEVDEQLKSNDY